MALTPLQPRYAKKVADADNLMAVIIGPGHESWQPGHGTHQATFRTMYWTAPTSSICVRQRCTRPTTASATPSPRYLFSRTIRSISMRCTGAVDGQKFGVE
ncbi:MAG: hypothetical protein CBHOC_4017 [uncultured Caballeronia sp.]|nr:MAG: hypothetical protein CBHOC_4017 [uncultured Caballeronia sp.]